MRRVAVLILVLGLVWVIARFLPGSDRPEGATATPVGADPGRPASAHPTADSTASPTASATASPTSSRTASTAPPPAESEDGRKVQPEGVCADSDVVLTPRVRDAHVGRPIDVVLRVTTRKAEACRWEVRPDSVYLRITQGPDTVWSSQQCPIHIPVEPVVPRRTDPDRVVVAWDGRLYDPECTTTTGWALPGRYAVAAVARGSVLPVETPFRLQQAIRPTVTASPTPTATPTAGPNGSPTGTPTGSPTARE